MGSRGLGRSQISGKELNYIIASGHRYWNLSDGKRNLHGRTILAVSVTQPTGATLAATVGSEMEEVLGDCRYLKEEIP